MRIKLGIPMRLSEIAKATCGRLNSRDDAMITHISTDSREVERGDLFIALKGECKDGVQYADEVRKKGGYVLSAERDKGNIFHPNGRTALLSLAYFYIKNLPYILYKIGITGSVGKTTTKEFLKILLSGSFLTHTSEGNFNNEIGLSLSVLSANKNTQILVLEMGMNHPGEIKRLSECLRPDIGIIINIGTAHIGNFGSREAIAKAKLEITDGMNNGALIVPHGEPLLSSCMKKSTFSISDPSASYYLKTEKENRISLFKNGEKYTDAYFYLQADQYKKCLIAAASAAMETGISPELLSSNISLISKDNTRQKVFRLDNYYFYTDLYNASRESVLAFLEIAESEEGTGSKSLLLGDILELGEMSGAIHREIGRAVSPKVFNNLFLFGDHIHQVALGAIDIGFPAERIFINNDLSSPDACAMMIRENCSAGDSIFMKASRAIRLERVLEYFRK